MRARARDGRLGRIKGQPRSRQGQGEGQPSQTPLPPNEERGGEKKPRLGERGGEQKTSHSLEGSARIKVSARAHVRAGGRS